MKISLSEKSISKEIIIEKLNKKFPDYKIYDINKNYFIVAKSSTIGCNVIIKEKQIYVVANFPTKIGQILFPLFVLLLGIIIPIILYFVIFHKKMRNFEKLIHSALQEIIND